MPLVNSQMQWKSIQENFDDIYINYFSRMLHFAKEYVLFEEDAENIVQDVFVFLWEKKDFVEIKTSLTTYLFTLVKNKCLDLIRHKMIAEEYSQVIMDEYKEELNMKLYSLEIFSQTFPAESDIEQLIRKAIHKLPEKCKTIFLKSRIEGKRYKEIADELHLSINTVEGQMSIALKKLRTELKDYLPLLIFLL